MSTVEIGRRFLEVENWSDFKGYWPIPGIREARFIHRTSGEVGAHIRVLNTDGSEHAEEIVEWVEGRTIGVRLYDFSPPLRWFASHFEER